MGKKTVRLLLVLVLCGLLQMTAAAYYTEITDLSEDFGEGGYSINGGELEKHSSIRDFAYLNSTRPGTTYFLPLRIKDFEWDESAGAGRSQINMRTVEELGITLYTDYQRGNHLFDCVKLAEQGGKTGILIDFVDAFPYLEEEEFLVEAKLLVHGEEFEDSAFRIRGTMSNSAIPVHKYDTTCTLGVGRYAYGYDNAKNVRFHLGAGVSITADIEFTDRYYGAAVERADKTDQELLQQYPQIQRVIQLETVGLGGNVSFDTGGAGTQLVYDYTLAYLGTTDQAVPYRGKYYLCSGAL